MNGVEIATVFNTVNDGKNWKAKSVQRSDRKSGAVDIVHFEQTNGMIVLTYDVEAGTFQVTFRKLQAAWKDYINAICRSLYVVLNSLKAGGLPFEAPHTLAGMRITASILESEAVAVAWAPPLVRPELVENITQALGYPTSLADIPQLSAPLPDDMPAFSGERGHN